ncbi:hypothetical protein HUJ04_003422 [Dendroctonus ponderosae]|nr:hypothetical protein HUJ04_003422 [Dendroctonus ponderosae]
MTDLCNSLGHDCLTKRSRKSWPRRSDIFASDAAINVVSSACPSASVPMHPLPLFLSILKLIHINKYLLLNLPWIFEQSKQFATLVKHSATKKRFNYKNDNPKKRTPDENRSSQGEEMCQG